MLAIVQRLKSFRRRDRCPSTSAAFLFRRAAFFNYPWLVISEARSAIAFITASRTRDRTASGAPSNQATFESGHAEASACDVARALAGRSGLHDEAGNPRKLAGSVEKLSRFHEAVVIKVCASMNGVDGGRRDAFKDAGSSRTRPGACREKSVRCRAGARGRFMHRGIWIENAAPIGVQRLRALFRAAASENRHEIGIEARSTSRNAPCSSARVPRKVARIRRADTGRMRLRIGQRQRRAQSRRPPSIVEGEFFADQFHVAISRGAYCPRGGLGAAAAGAR